MLDQGQQLVGVQALWVLALRRSPRSEACATVGRSLWTRAWGPAEPSDPDVPEMVDPKSMLQSSC